MEHGLYSVCPECGSNLRVRQPFCHVCGELCPAVWRHGNKAVELSEAPSKKTRTALLRTLRTWYPNIDAARARHRLKTGRSVLIRGIDDESGGRILDALRSFKIPGRLTTDTPPASWAMRLFNPGLALGGLLLLMAALTGGWTGLVLLAGAAGSPVAWSLWKNRQERPLVSADALFDYDRWSRLALDYGEAMKRLETADADILQSILTEVFDLYRLLSSGSLAAAAAGQEHGAFRERLTDAVATAIEIGRQMTELEGEETIPLRRELQSLADLAKSMGDWFRGLEREKMKASPLVAAELHEIVDRIDRTVREVRPTERQRRSPTPKMRG